MKLNLGYLLLRPVLNYGHKSMVPMVTVIQMLYCSCFILILNFYVYFRNSYFYTKQNNNNNTHRSNRLLINTFLVRQQIIPSLYQYPYALYNYLLLTPPISLILYSHSVRIRLQLTVYKHQLDGYR